MSAGRTLKKLRAEAVLGDRNLPALIPSPDLPYASNYMRPKLLATTLEELALSCGRFGEAAVLDAEWKAINVWLMWVPDALPAPSVVCEQATYLVSEDARVKAELPSLSGRPFQSVLATLSPELQEEAGRVAAEVKRYWKQAGSPHLERSIQLTERYIHACLRQEPQGITA